MVLINFLNPMCRKVWHLSCLSTNHDKREGSWFGNSVHFVQNGFGRVPMEMDKTTASKTVAAEKLISYARENPRASDTADGIARWWVKMPLDQVLPALESLVELGLWEKVRRDDRVLYRPIPASDAKETQ